MSPPPLSVLEPDLVARQGLGTVVVNRFLLPTHPEVFAIMLERAADPEAFVQGLIEARDQAP